MKKGDLKVKALPLNPVLSCPFTMKTLKQRSVKQRVLKPHIHRSTEINPNTKKLKHLAGNISQHTYIVLFYKCLICHLGLVVKTQLHKSLNLDTSIFFYDLYLYDETLSCRKPRDKKPKLHIIKNAVKKQKIKVFV